MTDTVIQVSAKDLWEEFEVYYIFLLFSYCNISLSFLYIISCEGILDVETKILLWLYKNALSVLALGGIVLQRNNSNRP